MEEFRAWLADRLAITLINRRQIGPEHFREREGGAVEFTDADAGWSSRPIRSGRRRT